jgi:hypothetical protein
MNDHNIEPAFEGTNYTKILNNNIRNDFTEWINVASPIGDNKMYDVKIRNFFQQIFRFLEFNNMCFSSGTFVFQNDLNIMFNLLTFGKLRIDSNSYNCDNFDKPENTTKILNDVRITGTITHKNVYEIGRELVTTTPNKCMPKKSYLGTTEDRKYTKFEKVFTPPISNLCGFCKDNGDETSEPKGVALYYPFTAKTNTYPGSEMFERICKFLFVKLEHASFHDAPMEHSLDYVNKKVGIKKIYDNVDTRREDDC